MALPPKRRTNVAAGAHTLRTLLADAHGRLRRARLSYGHGTTNAWDEAVYLSLFALRLPPDRLTPHLDRQLTAAQSARALKLIETRISRRIPAAYITREAWLGDERFYVDERVIVPRSYIAELLRDRLAPWVVRPARVKRVLDLCTGSGCLAILLAKCFTGAVVDAVDISRPALAVARRNVAAHGLAHRIRLIESDLFSALQAEPYDLIVSNPPYVSAARMKALPREYRHEPQLALAGGTDGFSLVRIILREASHRLSARGLLVVEIGHHRRRLEALYPRTPFMWPETSGGDDCVFIVGRTDLEVQARPAPQPHRATPAGAASRRR